VRQLFFAASAAGLGKRAIFDLYLLGIGIFVRKIKRKSHSPAIAQIETLAKVCFSSAC